MKKPNKKEVIVSTIKTYTSSKRTTIGGVVMTLEDARAYDHK